MPDIPVRLVHRAYWNDHLVEIKDHGDYRSLYYGSHHLQSRMSLSCPHRLVLAYTGYMMFPLLLNSSPRHILVTGIGSGSFVRFFQHHFPDCFIDAVDNSQHIIRAAKGYFKLPENDQVAIYCCDGYEFLQEKWDNRYDFILVDAFDATGMAPTIYAEPFFALCAKRLTPDGIVSCNLWSDDKRRLEELKKVLFHHFETPLFLPVHNRGNIVALALPCKNPWPFILQTSKKLTSLSNHYNLNFRRMVGVAKQNNLSLSKRLSSLLH